MSPIEETKKIQLLNNINKAVLSVLDAPELEALSEKQIESIAKKYYIEKLTNEFAREVKKKELDRDGLNHYVQQWLDGFSSRHTRRSFQKNIDLFLLWLNKKSIVEVDSRIADKYIVELKGNTALSVNTIRQRIASCSSFFSTLARWNVIDKNPFIGIRGLPKKKITVKQENQIPSNIELDTLEEYALKAIHDAQGVRGRGVKRKLSGNVYALAALKVLRSTGLRVGALQCLIIDKNRYYKAVSKGSVAQGRLSEEIVSFLDGLGLSSRQPFQHYSPNAFSIWLWRSLTGGELRKSINKIFSPHGIRHRFAIDFYKQTKDVHELCKRLGHSSLLVTTAYLSGLKSEIDE